MIRYMDLVLDLLDIDWGDQYRECIQYMVDHPHNCLYIHHPKAFVFEWFQQLLQGKITEEEFVAIGDSFLPVSSQNAEISSDIFVESIIYGIKQNPTIYTNSIVIVWSDCLSLDVLSNHLNQIHSQLFILPF